MRSEHHCERMAYAVAEERLPVAYFPRFREWGVYYRDGLSFYTLEYCPWDGEKLPDSLREEYFRRLWDDLGLEIEDPRIPEEMLSDRWWKEAGL